MHTIHERLQTIRELEDLLRAEATKRSTKPTELWIADERAAMLEAVNSRRLSAHKTAASLDDVARAERQAMGHSDYVHKFALHCAFLVEE